MYFANFERVRKEEDARARAAAARAHAATWGPPGGPYGGPAGADPWDPAGGLGPPPMGGWEGDPVGAPWAGAPGGDGFAGGFRGRGGPPGMRGRGMGAPGLCASSLSSACGSPLGCCSELRRRFLRLSSRKAAEQPGLLLLGVSCCAGGSCLSVVHLARCTAAHPLARQWPQQRAAARG